MTFRQWWHSWEPAQRERLAVRRIRGLPSDERTIIIRVGDRMDLYLSILRRRFKPRSQASAIAESEITAFIETFHREAA